MSERPILRFANRGWRDQPAPTTRVRGGGELPYNPRRPLTLRGDRRKRRPPQFRTEALLRLLIPLGLLGGLGVGVFFGIEALLDEDEAPPSEQAAAEPETAAGDAVVASVEGGTEAPEAEVGPIDATAEPAAEPGTETEAAEATGVAAAPAAGGVVTEAALGGAPIVVERGGATPIPPGISNLTLADGSAYDPGDSTTAFSSVWPAGTVLDLIRLPGGPLLTEEDAAMLIGKTVQVVVRGSGEFPTELQLSPAAYTLLARDFEPIIALRIEAVAAPTS